MDEPYKAYVLSVYFIVQTMTTVGYGDVGPASTPERIFVITLMLGGVFVFSMTTGMLASVLTSADEVSATESMLKSQLYRVSETFDLKPELHAKLQDYIFAQDEEAESCTLTWLLAKLSANPTLKGEVCKTAFRNYEKFNFLSAIDSKVKNQFLFWLTNNIEAEIIPANKEIYS